MPVDDKTFEALLKENSAAEMLNVSVRTMQNWRFIGAGPAYIRFGRAVRYRTDDLQAFVLHQRLEAQQYATELCCEEINQGTCGRVLAPKTKNERRTPTGTALKGAGADASNPRSE